MRVVNMGSEVVKEGTPDKEKSPYNPYRENNPLLETRQVCNYSCLSRAGARARAGQPKRKKRTDWAFIQRLIETAVGEAVRTFHGTWSAETGGDSDERLWAGIARRIGANNMHFAVIDCLAEMRDQRFPVKEKDQARYFQAFLNRHYPKPEGGAK